MSGAASRHAPVIGQPLLAAQPTALPKPLVQAFQWSALRNAITADAVITVVDAPALAAGRFTDNQVAVDAQRRADDNLGHDSPLAELFEDPLVTFDLVVVHKTDGMNDAALTRVDATIRMATLPDVAMRLVVQGVGQRFDSCFDRAWRRDETRTTQQVLIEATTWTLMCCNANSERFCKQLD